MKKNKKKNKELKPKKKLKDYSKIIDNILVAILIILVIILWSKGHFECKCPVYECINGEVNVIWNNLTI